MTPSKTTRVLTSSHRGNDEWLQITPGERFRIRISADATEGAFTILELVADPRNGVPMHIHQNEDEHFVVLEGTLHLANGDKTLNAPAGTAVTVSKGVPDAWCNLTDAPLRMLIIFSPGHIEGLFKATADRGGGDVAVLAAGYGTLIVGPPLFEGIRSINSPRA